ncbi:MAG: MFS transporter [Firmicutes bacterium]|nr:MFS transporter [Bacillota bacterium]
MKKMTKDQLRVLIGACIFQASMVGIIYNCFGIFSAAIKADLAMSMTKISAYQTIRALTATLTGALVSRLFFKSSKRIFARLMILSVVVGYSVMALGANGVLWYAGASMVGLFVTFGSVALSEVLSKHFTSDIGYMTGIACAFSGVSVLTSPLASSLIVAFGWRIAMAIFLAATLCFGFLGIQLMLPKKFDYLFEETGAAVKKDSAASAAAPSQPVVIENKLAKFILITLVLCNASVLIRFIQNVTVFAQSAGYTLATGALLNSLLNVGNIGGKVLFGKMCDKLNPFKAELAFAFGVTVAVCIFLFFPGNLYLLYFASFIYGLSYSMNSVGLPRMTVYAYGKEGQKKMIGLHLSLFNAVAATVSMLIGILYDRFGSFDLVLYLCLTAGIVMMLASFLGDRLVAREKKGC